ncbi:MAG: cytochrome c biogenesis protein [Bacillota bacterium]|nr:cytochrome c biogenesis protein [Bacillota bacterium]
MVEPSTAIRRTERRGRRRPARLPWLEVSAGLAVPVALYLGLVWAPPERVMGDVQRIMYFHVASAMTAYLAFGLVAVASAIYLLRRQARWDRVAVAAAEVGVLFTTLTLLSGSIWARSAWNAWWLWQDARLTTTLLMWFLYAGYLLLRAAAREGDGQGGRLAALYGLLSVAIVPVVHFSVVWWYSNHPQVITPQGIRMAPQMVVALLAASVAVLLVGVVLFLQRWRLEELRDRLAELEMRCERT